MQAAAGAGAYELKQTGSMFQQYGAGGSAGAAAGQGAETGAINLKMRCLYGVNPQVNPSVLSIDDNQIVYVCGHNVVIYNTESKTYRFIQGKWSRVEAPKYLLKHD